MTAVVTGVGEGLRPERVEFAVTAPNSSLGWRRGRDWLMRGPEGALVLGVVAYREPFAFGEGGGAVGEEEKE